MVEKFERGIAPRDLDRLIALATCDGGNWWKDLLRKWRPSGQDSGNDGLRLAIRKNGLNFYRMGQSVSRLSFARDRTPQSRLHVKYVLGSAAGKKNEAILRGTTVFLPGGATLPYGGAEMLEQWTARAFDKSGPEKIVVDRIIANTSTAIDVEAAWSGAKTLRGKDAPRIDLVMLATAAHRASILFVEVKKADDGRMPQSEDSALREETHHQLRVYRDFLSVGSNQRQVATAYRRACQATAALLAATERTESCRDSATLEAIGRGDMELAVDPVPKLAVEWPERSSARRLSHAALRARFGEFPIAVMTPSTPESYALSSASFE